MTESEATIPVHPELAHITKSVFETMFGIEVHGVEAKWAPPADRVTAAVHLLGPWKSVVMVDATRQQARRFAERYLSLPATPPFDDDVRDVLGELVNMIGGNVKSAISPGAQLSMPSVVDGDEFCVRLGRGATVERQAFSCELGVFWVSRITLPDEPDE